MTYILNDYYRFALGFRDVESWSGCVSFRPVSINRDVWNQFVNDYVTSPVVVRLAAMGKNKGYVQTVEFTALNDAIMFKMAYSDCILELKNYEVEFAFGPNVPLFESGGPKTLVQIVREGLAPEYEFGPDVNLPNSIGQYDTPEPVVEIAPGHAPGDILFILHVKEVDTAALLEWVNDHEVMIHGESDMMLTIKKKMASFIQLTMAPTLAQEFRNKFQEHIEVEHQLD